MGILSETTRLASWLPAIIGASILLLILRPIVAAFKPSLRGLPGPSLARFTPFYRAWKMSKGDAPIYYRSLHKQYGPIVRTGPNTVDISDPKALPIIYGISSKFLKVSLKNI